MEYDHVKAGRWMGYVLRGVEELGLFTNQQSRDLIREDEKLKRITVGSAIEAIESIAERMAKRAADNKSGKKKSLEEEVPELIEMKMTTLLLKGQLGFMTKGEIGPLSKELLAKRGSR
jgi:hypothetical protein